MSRNKQEQVPKKNEVSIFRSSAAEYLTFVAASGHGGIEAVYNMGPTSWKDASSGKILKFDVVIAKNYLAEKKWRNCSGWFRLIWTWPRTWRCDRSR